MPQDPRSLLERHPYWNSRGTPPYMAEATRRAMPVMAAPDYSTMPPDQLQAMAQQGDPNAAAEVGRRAASGSLPRNLRGAPAGVDLTYIDPAIHAGDMPPMRSNVRARAQSNAAQMNLTDTIMNFIRGRISEDPASTARGYLANMLPGQGQQQAPTTPRQQQAPTSAPAATSPAASAPAYSGGFQDPYAGSENMDLTARKLGVPLTPPPINKVDTGQQFNMPPSPDSGYGKGWSTQDGLQRFQEPEAQGSWMDKVPWATVGRFGLDLLQAAEPKPGSPIGPSFGGAVGEAGSKTWDRLDASEAAAAKRQFTAQQNELDRQVKRADIAATKELRKAQQDATAAQNRTANVIALQNSISRVETEISRRIADFEDKLGDVMAPEKMSEDYKKRNKSQAEADADYKIMLRKRLMDPLENARNRLDQQLQSLLGVMPQERPQPAGPAPAGRGGSLDDYINRVRGMNPPAAGR